MTCREKLAIEHPGYIDPDFRGGCFGCPNDHGYLAPIEECYNTVANDELCTRCWNREIPESKQSEPEKPKHCSWCTDHKGRTNLEFSIIDDDFCQFVKNSMIKFCPFCGRELNGDANS